MVSYSGPLALPCVAYGPSLISTSRPQAITQPWQATVPVRMVSAISRPAHLARAFEGGGGPVFLRHIAQDLQVIGRAGGAGGLEHGGHILLEQILIGGHAQAFVHVRGGKLHPARRGCRRARAGMHAQRFEVLGAHQRAQPGARRGPPVVREDAGVGHPVLPGQPDTGHLRLGHAQLRAHEGLRLVGIRLAPQMFRRADLNLHRFGSTDKPVSSPAR